MTGMRFTRRIFIGGSVATITAIALSGCTNPAADVFVVDDDGQFFSAAELTILADVAEIMIPRTDTPGAMDAQVAPVVDGMMLTWAVEETRDQFRRALAAFDESAEEKHGSSYVELALPEREAIVRAMDEAAFAEGAEADGADYRRLKELIFRVFYTSEPASANLVPVPGSYDGNLTLAEYEAFMQERSYGG